MVKEDILEGLKVAISKGESLRQAMQSFYNSGYNKRDIEEAAKALQYSINQEQTEKSKIIKPQNKIEEPTKVPQIQPPKTTQKISNYEQQKNPRKKMIIIVVSLLVILLIILAGIFFFREKLLEFFNKFFG